MDGGSGRSSGLGYGPIVWSLVLTLLLGAIACVPGQVSKRRQVAPSAGAVAGSPPPAMGSLAEWQARGATEVPPPSVRAASLAGIELVNETAGAVSDADARSWAEGFVRADRYEVWAMNAMQDRFLRAGGLSKEPDSVFSSDFGYITEALSQNKRIRDTGLTYHRLILRTVPKSLEPAFTAQGYSWSAYAFYVDFGGPFELSYYGRDGQSASKVKLDAGLLWPQVMGGEYDTHDSLMEPLWVLRSDWSCLPSYNQEILGSLCSGT